MNQLLFEKDVRSLIANCEEPLKTMYQFIKDHYISEDHKLDIMKALLLIDRLKNQLNPQDKEIKKWDQIPLIKD
jgi:hypothetical protein